MEPPEMVDMAAAAAMETRRRSGGRERVEKAAAHALESMSVVSLRGICDSHCERE